MRNILIGLLLLTASGVCAAKQPEKIRYEDIPNRLAPFGSVIAYRGIMVTAVDGKRYPGRRLRLEPDYVRVFPLDSNAWIDIPAEDVTQIKITQTARYIHHVSDTAVFGSDLLDLCDGDALLCGMGLVIAPPVFAYLSVSAPVYLAADLVALFKPAKVYEIIH